MAEFKKASKDWSRSQQINQHNDNDLILEGRISEQEFADNELNQIYADLGIARHYVRKRELGHSITDYSNWTHYKAESGYSIWSYPVSDFLDASSNLLFMDNVKFTYKGEADSLDISKFAKVLNVFEGTVFDVTEEAGTEGGTAFSFLQSADGMSTWLYLCGDEKFNAIDFDIETVGGGINLELRYWNGSEWSQWDGSCVISNFIDNTSNLLYNGRIEYDLPSDWISSEIDGTTGYWIMLSTTSNPTQIPTAYHILPGNSVPSLLRLSQAQIVNDEWAWCFYNGYIYVTLKNSGDSYYEGDLFIKSTSSVENLQAFFISNHKIKVSYLKEECSSGFNFINIKDVPNSYTGASHKLVAVKEDESGLEFISNPGYKNNFIELDDTPSSYLGQSGKYTCVNQTEDGLEFSDVDIIKTVTKVIGFTDDCDYICDGASDDIQIQLAITEVGISGGGTIRFRKGTYNCLNTITSCQFIVFEGESRYETIIKDTRDFGGSYAGNANFVELDFYNEIKNLTLKNETNGTTSGYCLIKIESKDYVNILNSDICVSNAGYYTSCINISGTNNNIFIDRCYLYNPTGSGNAIILYTSGSTISTMGITNCIIISGQLGILNYNGNFTDLKVCHNSITGPRLNGYFYRSIFANNYFDGFSLSGGGFVWIRDGSENVIVEGNIAIAYFSSGCIEIGNSCSNILIHDNYLRNSANWPIVATGTSPYVFVFNNVFYDAATNNTITGSAIKFNNIDPSGYPIGWTQTQKYETHPTFNSDTQLVDKKYVDDKYHVWTTATRPNSPTQGMLGYNTDFNGTEVYQTVTGRVGWLVIGGYWTVATRPSSVVIGSRGYNLDLETFEYLDVTGNWSS